MKKIFRMFVIVVMLGFVPVMTSCQGLIDAIVGTEDNPSTTPTVSHITGITLSGEGIVTVGICLSCTGGKGSGGRSSTCNFQKLTAGNIVVYHIFIQL